MKATAWHDGKVEEGKLSVGYLLDGDNYGVPSLILTWEPHGKSVKTEIRLPYYLIKTMLLKGVQIAKHCNKVIEEERNT